jgi:hypothetical protein
VRTVAITLLVCGLLLIAKLVLQLPGRLVITLSISFLIVSAIYWALRRRTPRSPGIQVIQLLLPWAIGTAILLATVYYVDRASWWLTLTGYDARGTLSTGDFLKQHPWFSIDPRSTNELVLRKGQYDIRETVVVPRGSKLTIEPGTVLLFREGSSLISYSPIWARGTKSNPIRFAARMPGLKWGVVGIVSAEKSVFEHVQFENGQRAVVNHITFPGGLSLIDSDVEIQHSEFRNLFGSDGVYVRNASVLIRDNLFQDIRIDGLDLDFGTGEISHNRFINCGDEGIDLSGDTDVRVHDNVVLDDGGGRIAADHDLGQIRSLNTLGYLQGNPR